MKKIGNIKQKKTILTRDGDIPRDFPTRKRNEPNFSQEKFNFEIGRNTTMKKKI